MGWMFCCIANEFLGCGRRVCAVVTFCLCLGPALLIVAIAMFIVAAKDPRGDKIGQYNYVVDQWVSSQYAAFEALNLSLSVNDQRGIPHNATPYTDPDPIDDSGSTIRRYNEHLRYEYFGSVLKNPSEGTSKDSVTVSLESGERTVVGVNSYVTQSYNPSQLGCTHSCKSSYDCYDSATCALYCSNKNGHYNYLWDQCYVIKYIEEVCVKIQDDGTFLGSDNKCFEEAYGDWQPDTEEGDKVPRDIPPITVVIRSASDPFITLYKITGGDLWFGLTATQYATIGVVFVVVGGFFCAAIAALFIFVCYQGHCMCFKDRVRF